MLFTIQIYNKTNFNIASQNLQNNELQKFLENGINGINKNEEGYKNHLFLEIKFIQK